MRNELRDLRSRIADMHRHKVELGSRLTNYEQYTN